MINLIEDKLMIHHIPDSSMKPMDSDGRIKAKEQATKQHTLENTSSDCVSLSSTSKQLEALKMSLQDSSDINISRVSYFKNQIESGNYQIHSDKIAMKMLNSVEMI